MQRIFPGKLFTAVILTKHEVGRKKQNKPYCLEHLNFLEPGKKEISQTNYLKKNNNNVKLKAFFI